MPPLDRTQWRCSAAILDQAIEAGRDGNIVATMAIVIIEETVKSPLEL
jgi:hypothetical protein